MPTDDFEPIGYDGFSAPLYDHQVDSLPDFRMRFITGIDPGNIDPEAFKPDVIWQIPEPMTIETRHIDPDVLEILFGQPMIPLCGRQIPAQGTE